MLKLIRSNNPFTVLILFIFCLAIRYKVLIHPVAPIVLQNHYLYNTLIKYLATIFGGFNYGYIFLSIVLLFFQAIYLVNISARYKLFNQANYVPAFVYILLSAINPNFSLFSETLIINWILLITLDIILSFAQTTQPRKSVFNAGFFLGLAMIFQFSTLAFFILLLVGLIMFRSFHLGEWSVSLMGVLTPVYFFICIMFLFDNLSVCSQWMRFNLTFSPVNNPLSFFLTLFGIGILLFAGSFVMQSSMALSNIFIRRAWIVITFYFLSSIIAGLVTDSNNPSGWLISMLPLSLIVSCAFALEKNKLFSNFIFYFSLLFAAFCVWVNK